MSELMVREKFDIESNLKMADIFAKSDIVPKEFKGKPENIFVAMRTGWELGLSLMQSVQSIAVINGRASVWGDTALALVQSSGICESIEEKLEGGVATCTVKRKGWEVPIVRTFSIAEARRAELTGKEIWKKYENRMLQMRARSYALRDGFADVLKGLALTEEVMDYSQPKEVNVTKYSLPIPVDTVYISVKKREIIFEILRDRKISISSFEEKINSFFGFDCIEHVTSDKWDDVLKLAEECNGNT